MRISSKKVDQVYQRPGARFDGYAQYGLAPCEVAFRRNWMRDQNSDRMDLNNRVTQEDVDRIKDRLSADCDKYFRQALLASPAYPLTDQFDRGENVLVLRPAIINLDINAPDVRSTGMSRSYTTSAGEMTLVLEAVDGTTGDTIARVVDRHRAMDTGHLTWTNAVTNKAEADRTLLRWADQLRSALDELTRD
ncbi:MAG: DUF3313 family protein [Halioglobus sp.]|nr:DUF3313 family protein [Halioglobus sp.]